MISGKPYYDVGSARSARFSKTYSAKKAFELAKNFEGKVKLFEDYYRGWYLIPLKQNLREGTALITAAILLSLCDVLEQFRRGAKSTGHTGVFVKAALKNIYKRGIPQGVSQKTVDDLINQIYEVLRNGLHHDLATRGIHVYVSGGVAVMFEQDKSGKIVELWFNPLNFLNAVERDFLRYTQALRNKSDKTIVDNFEKMFKLVFNL